jgi:hypothetical protein
MDFLGSASALCHDFGEIVAVRGVAPLDEDEDIAEEGSEPLSRSERKRRAEALQKLGVRLTRLRAGSCTLQLPPRCSMR